MSAQQNFITNSTVYQIGFRYDLPYIRLGCSALQSNNITTLSEFASGSLIYQPKINYLNMNVNTNVGRGGLIFLPFLDINNNGRKDTNEPKASGLNVMLSGGGIQKCNQDTIIVISGLEPYTTCFVEADANSFENMAWRIKNPKMNIAIEPNKFKLIEIPISIVGEASGTVSIKKKNEETRLGRILVCFYSKDSVLIFKTLTETDGYFSYLGLMPGDYYVKIDQEQLNKLQLTSFPSSIPITIKSNMDGDVIDDLKFILEPQVKEIQNSAYSDAKIMASKNGGSFDNLINATSIDLKNGLFFTVQLGAFMNKKFPTNLKDIPQVFSITLSDGGIRYSTGVFHSVEEAKTIQSQVISIGVIDAFITAYYKGERITIAEAERLLRENGPGMLEAK